MASPPQAPDSPRWPCQRLALPSGSQSSRPRRSRQRPSEKSPPPWRKANAPLPQAEPHGRGLATGCNNRAADEQPRSNRKQWSATRKQQQSKFSA
eukprot:15475386-Alexandrium_andersonii.AAC.1